jgi:hypothetical protein
MPEFAKSAYGSPSVKPFRPVERKKSHPNPRNYNQYQPKPSTPTASTEEYHAHREACEKYSSSLLKNPKIGMNRELGETSE